MRHRALMHGNTCSKTR